MNWKTDLKVSDLDPAERLEATCRRCGAVRYETRGGLEAVPGLAEAPFDRVEKRLRCRLCGGPMRLSRTFGHLVTGFVGGMA